jgi:hypothetical protein
MDEPFREERRCVVGAYEDPGGQLLMMFVCIQASYYFAHRVQDTLEEEELPHIVGLEGSVMITILRCHLIEHPYRRLRASGEATAR